MTKTEGKRQSNCPITADPQKRNEADCSTGAIKGNLPAGLAQPALRALASAGIKQLADFTKLKESDLVKMHGIGPNAMTKIKKVMDEAGLSFLA